MLRRLAQLARVLLLGISLLAASTAWVWIARPHWVDALDDRLVAAHEAEPLAALARAMRDGQTPPERAAALAELLGRLHDVRKGDRLAECKRQALAARSEALLAAGDAPAAAASVAAWQTFDPLDLDAKLAAHGVALALGEPVRAAELARELFTLAPDRARFFEPHLAACRARGDDAAVAEAFFAHLRAGGTPACGDVEQGWELLRDDGDGFEPTRREPLDVALASGELSVRFTPAHDCKRLRLQFPPGAALHLRQARFRIATAEAAVDLPLRDLARQTGGLVGEHALRQEGETLVVEGHDRASLLWSLGPGARVATTWTLSGSVEPVRAPWLADVLALAAVGERGRILLAGDAVEDAGARARYAACRRAALLGAAVQVQVGDGAPESVPLVAAGGGAGGGARFAATIRRGSADRLRLVLPQVAALDVELEAPFAAAARLVPAPGIEAAGAVVRARSAGAALELALDADDPAAFELRGELR